MNLLETDVMIDVETLGVTANAVVLSIGAVAFRTSTKEILSEFEVIIDVESALEFGDVDASTLKWWMKQERVARDLVMSGETETEDAVYLFKDWYLSNTPSRVWGLGPSFDITLMERLFHFCDKEILWRPWQIRDVRTVIDIVSPLMSRPSKFEGTEHSAIDDARHQAIFTMDMLTLICERMK